MIWTGPAMQSQVDRQIAAIAAYLALQRFQGEMGHAKATDTSPETVKRFSEGEK